MTYLGAQNSIALGVQGIIHIDTGTGGGAASYSVTKSLRFRSSASAYLSRTFGTPTNNKIQTFSFWVKRGAITSAARQAQFTGYDGSSSNNMWISFETNDTFYVATGGAAAYEVITTQVFRDPAAWYHFVIAFDTTQATASNRVKIYVNGSQVTSFGTTNYPPQNQILQFAYANANNKIGTWWNNTVSFFDGEMAEVNFIDGQALAPTAFGAYSTYSQWLPIAYAGTYGTNGFYLPLTNTTSTSTLVADSSGNGNNWTPNNISLTAGSTYDSLTDVPTLTSTTAANYVVWNPLWQGRTNSPTNGNLDYPASSVGIGTMDLSTGSFYWEITAAGGIATVAVYSTSASSSAAVALGLTYGFRFNGTTGAFDYTTNGTTFTSIATGLTSGPYFIYVSTAALTTANLNAGQRPLAYTAPTGFVALNTYNI